MTEPTLTTSAGAPVADNQNSLTASSLGPVLIEDHGLIETLARRNLSAPWPRSRSKEIVEYDRRETWTQRLTTKDR